MLQPTPNYASQSTPTNVGTPTTTRDAILDAAGLLLGRFGFHKTTMDDLAREAGVARRTLYLHFRSKDEIFLARIDRVVARLLVEMRAIAATSAPADERLRQLVQKRVLYRFDTVRGYAQSLDEIFQALRQPYLTRREGYFAAEALILSEVLEEGRRLGEFYFDDAQETARALICSTSGLIPYSLSPKELGSRRDVERLTSRISELLIEGLRKPRVRSNL